MKLEKSKLGAYALQTLFQIIFLVIGIYTHDWFWLAVVWVISPNLYRIINYTGEEK